MTDASKDTVTAINPVSRKVSKILESKVETDKETLDALKTIADFYTDNSQQSRRNLRRDIERRSLEVNREFLGQFKSVKEQLDFVVENVNSMALVCADMSKRLQATKEQTRDLINQTTNLQTESKRLETREQIAAAFLAAFQLKPQEIRALKGTVDGNITQDFFPALARVKQIHVDCKLLLRSNQSKAGLEIMETMSKAQETAYEHLYRWVQRESRLLNVDTVELSPLLCEAMKSMEDRPVLFKYSLDEFSSARRNHIVRSFIDALTRGGPGGVPKPIELLSHDATRYIGDMSAWIHQALASEKELLNQLLRLCSAVDVKESMPKVLCHITEGLCRPYKVRVEQVLTGDNSPAVLYKLSNLFVFYVNTMQAVLGADAPLLQTLAELRELTGNIFYSSLNSSLVRLLDKIQPPGEDLQPVQGLHQALLFLRDVLESHDAALVPLANKQQNYNRIFGAVVDPLVQTLMLSGTQLNAIESAVYMLNCLHALHSMLSLYEYSDRRLEMLQAQIDAQCDVLVSEQAGYILKRTQMTSLYNVVVQHQASQGPLSTLPDADPQSIKSGLDKFDLFLGSPDSYLLPQARLVGSIKIRDLIKKRTMDVIYTAYGQIHAKIYDIANKYAEPSTIMPKHVEHVKALLM